MKTAKVTKIISATEWNGDHGTTFYIKMEMDNGETITLGKKTKDAFKLGDEIKYESYQDAKGYTKYKEVRENTFKKSYNSESNNRGALVGLAYKIAFEKAYNGEDDFQATIQLANRIFEEAMATFNKKLDNIEEKSEPTTPAESLKEKAKEEQDEELPF